MPLAGWLVGLGAHRIASGSGAALEYLDYAAFTLARVQPQHFGGNGAAKSPNKHCCSYFHAELLDVELTMAIELG